MNDDPIALEILSLRGEIAELGGAIRQLQRSGMDSAPAQLLISRERGELECLMSLGNDRKVEAVRRCVADVYSKVTPEQEERRIRSLARPLLEPMHEQPQDRKTNSALW